MMAQKLLIATWAFIAGFMFFSCALEGNPWRICTEAKAKNIVLFSCNEVKLP